MIKSSQEKVQDKETCPPRYQDLVHKLQQDAGRGLDKGAKGINAYTETCFYNVMGARDKRRKDSIKGTWKIY